MGSRTNLGTLRGITWQRESFLIVIPRCSISCKKPYSFFRPPRKRDSEKWKSRARHVWKKLARALRKEQRRNAIPRNKREGRSRNNGGRGFFRLLPIGIYHGRQECADLVREIPRRLVFHKHLPRVLRTHSRFFFAKCLSPAGQHYCRTTHAIKKTVKKLLAAKKTESRCKNSLTFLTRIPETKTASSA